MKGKMLKIYRARTWENKRNRMKKKRNKKMSKIYKREIRENERTELEKENEPDKRMRRKVDNKKMLKGY